MNKRKDECFICSSRSCYQRVVSVDNGETYDEIACINHINDLHKDSDVKAPGILKRFVFSTGKQKRGTSI